MAKWDEQLTFEEVSEGDELPELVLPLTVQRLVMEAAANRDFVPLHHDDAAAQRTGAPAMFANTWYYMALSERHLREWVGLEGEILKIGPFRMGKFACPGVVLHCGARVVEKREENGKNVVELDIWQDDGTDKNMWGKALVALPAKQS